MKSADEVPEKIKKSREKTHESSRKIKERGGRSQRSGAGIFRFKPF